MLKLGHPASQVMAASMLSQAAVVVSGPLAVRLLGVEDRGEAAFVFAAVLLVSQVGPWGLPQAWSFYIARGDVSARTLLRRLQQRFAVRTLVVSVLGATAMNVVALQGDGLSSPVRATAVAIGGMATIMGAILIMACLQGEHMFNHLAVAQAIPGVTYATAMLVLLVAGHASVELVLALNFSGWALVVIIGAFGLRAHTGHPDRQVPTSRALASYGRRALVSAAAPIDNLGIDQLAVAILLSHEALGLYVIGLAFESGPALILVALASVCTPSVAAITDPADRRRFCLRWLSLALGVGLAATAATQVAVKVILVPAFGPEAAPAIPVAHILVVAGLFLGLRRVTGGMLQGSGQPTRATIAELVGLVAMLVPMSMADSITDACVALLVGGAVSCAISLTMLLRSFGRASIASSEPSAPR